MHQCLCLVHSAQCISSKCGRCSLVASHQGHKDNIIAARINAGACLAQQHHSGVLSCAHLIPLTWQRKSTAGLCSSRAFVTSSWLKV